MAAHSMSFRGTKTRWIKLHKTYFNANDAVCGQPIFDSQSNNNFEFSCDFVSFDGWRAPCVRASRLHTTTVWACATGSMSMCIGDRWVCVCVCVEMRACVRIDFDSCGELLAARNNINMNTFWLQHSLYQMQFEYVQFHWATSLAFSFSEQFGSVYIISSQPASAIWTKRKMTKWMWRKKKKLEYCVPTSGTETWKYSNTFIFFFFSFVIISWFEGTMRIPNPDDEPTRFLDFNYFVNLLELNCMELQRTEWMLAAVERVNCDKIQRISLLLWFLSQSNRQDISNQIGWRNFGSFGTIYRYFAIFLYRRSETFCYVIMYSTLQRVHSYG